MSDLSSTVWRCAECGQEYEYPDRDGKHGGPRNRTLDRRYALLYSCWRNKRCASHKRKLVLGRVILLSPVAPNPEQPEQDMDAIQFGPRHRSRKEAT